MTDPPPTPSARIRWPWLAAVVPLAFGAYLGYQVAYQSSVGGLGGALGAAFLAYAIGGLVVLAVLVGLANQMRRGGRGRRASQYSFAAAGLFALGAGGGWAAVPVLDLGYHPPVVLQARGEASVALEGIPAFEPRDAGRADCQSVADGTDVERVVALSLGDLSGGLLRADISLPVEGVSSGYVSLFVDAATLPSGSIPPTWEQAQPEVDAAVGRASGSLRFDGAQLRTGEELGAATGDWPATLSGTLTWLCGEWFALDASPPTAVIGEVTLDLSEGSWSGASGAQASCEFEADGSVWTVTAGDAGLLKGEPLSVALDLGGDPRSGDEVHLGLSVHLPTPSGGATLPLGALVAATSGRIIGWAGLVTIDEVGAGGRSGRLDFTDVPIETTPDPTWPQALSGQLGWECG